MSANPMLNKLLVQSIAATNTASNSTRTPPAPMDPEKRKFLENALKEITYDVSEKMREYIEVIRHPEGKTNVSLCEALLGLQFECEQLDAAADVYKMHGTEPIIALLAHSDTVVRKYAAWVLATCMSQNPEVHRQVEEFNLLPKFLELAQQEQGSDAIQKFLLCISSLVRENPIEQRHFQELNGFQVLAKMCKHASPKIRCKAMFMIYAFLCQVTKVEVEQIAVACDLISVLSEILKLCLATIASTGDVEESVATGCQNALSTLCLFLPNIPPTILAQARQQRLAVTLQELEAAAAKDELLRNILGDVLVQAAGFQLAS